MNVPVSTFAGSNVPRRLPKPRPFWPGLLCWLPVAVSAGIAVGGLSVLVAPYFSPLGVFPLALGALWGCAAVFALRLCRLAHRPSIALGTLVSIALLIVAQHVASYWLAERARQEQKGADLAQLAFPEFAPSFAQYLSREAAAGRAIGPWRIQGAAVWASWCVDAALTLSGAATVLAFGLARPYCNLCHSWYRVVRTGLLGPEQARAVAAAIALVLPDDLSSTVRYELWQCQTGCGPARLDLAWTVPRPGRRQAWLDHDARKRTIERLDDLVSTARVALEQPQP